MLKEELEKLVEDPNVLYIYEIGLQIYGLFEGVEDRDFLVIVNNDCIIPTVNDGNFTFVRIKDWFEHVLSNDIVAWECACLPKKYILKEHVKLLLQTDPLKLRKEFDKKIKTVYSKLPKLFSEGNTLTAQKELFELIKYLIFANQIIENHKIVNFKVIGNIYKQMVDGTVTDQATILDTASKLSESPGKIFANNTDSILRASKIKKILSKNT